MKKYILLTLLLIAKGAGAQNECRFSLNGRVVDLDTKEPLAWARIVVGDSGQGALTDEEGMFSISRLCAGTYTVSVMHIGCETLTEQIVVRQNTHRDFFLPHSLQAGVEIEEERPKERATQDEEVVTREKLEQGKGKVLGEILSSIPGVNQLKNGNSVSKPVIHGMHSNRVLILNNGVRQEGQQWGADHGPEIDPFLAGQLSVVKGANTVRYGPDAIAGVVIVQPRALPDSAGLNSEINLVGNTNGRAGTASAMVEGVHPRILPLSFRVQGTFKRGGNLHAPDYYIANTGVLEYNFSTAARFKKENYGFEYFYSQFNTHLGIYSGSHTHNLTDLMQAIESDTPLVRSGFSYAIERPRQSVEHELGKALAWFRTGQSGKMTITVARQFNRREEFDKHKPLQDTLAALDLPEVKYVITTWSGDAVWEHNSFHGFIGSAGVSLMAQANRYSGKYFIPEYQNITGGIFWMERYRIRNLTLEGGIRFDHKKMDVLKWEKVTITDPHFRFSNFSGSLGAVLLAGHHWEFRINAGSAWRSPNVNELFSNGVHHGVATVEIGDPGLKPERALNFITTTKFHKEGSLLVEADIYHNQVFGFIYAMPVFPPTLTIRGAFPTYRFTQAHASFTGGDISATAWITRNLTFSPTISILRAWNHDAKQWLILMPSDRYKAELNWKIPLRSRRCYDFYVEANGTWVLHQKRIPDSQDYAPPPPAYFLLGAEAGMSFHIGRQSLDAGISAQNLLNANYREYLNRFRYFVNEPGRMISFRITMHLMTHPHR